MVILVNRCMLGLGGNCIVLSYKLLGMVLLRLCWKFRCYILLFYKFFMLFCSLKDNIWLGICKIIKKY